ncbi:hypothetical protein [Bullifex porci]|uniref:hypothetical protein n=1 Tax=Bullifex porci TaxID=2606638 RepID=UPI0023F310FA|nr:hypothetical protein [Bullifex porci]MDD7254908.1 hypothetical protein [Bullifex porci]MDD7589076.1 hypothetical protein [Bullifex porci]MDY2741593.1 hypothetical protein [Bullifex porci]
MEQQIQDLVASIKKEGIEEAKKQSAEILASAKAEAEEIIKKAKAEGDKIIQDAKNSAKLEAESAKAQIVQAGRDVTLSLKQSVEALFNKILVEDCKKAMDASLLAQLITQAVNADLNGVTAEIPEGLKDDVVKALSSEVAKLVKQKDFLKESKGVLSGIKLSSNDGSGYIDMSASECALLVKPYLSERLRELIG